MLNRAGRRAAGGTLRMILGIACGGLAIAAAATPAAAHTSLESSSPSNGSQLNAAPPQVVLDFNGPVRTGVARLIISGPAGRVKTPPPQVISDKVVMPLQSPGRIGAYRIEFRVVALDGHPLSGTIRFTLGQPGAAAAPVPDRPGARVPVKPPADDPGGGGPAPWIFALGAVGATAIVAGAVWFGRRVTRDLD